MRVAQGAAALLVPVMIGAHFPGFPRQLKDTYLGRVIAQLRDNGTTIGRTAQLAVYVGATIHTVRALLTDVDELAWCSVASNLIVCEEDHDEDTSTARLQLLGVSQPHVLREHTTEHGRFTQVSVLTTYWHCLCCPVAAQVFAALIDSALPADRARALRFLAVLQTELGDMVERIRGFEAVLRRAAAEESRELQQEAARTMLTLAVQDDAEQWDDLMATYFPWILERLVPFVQANDMRACRCCCLHTCSLRIDMLTTCLRANDVAALAMTFFTAIAASLERDPAWLNTHVDVREHSG